MVEHLASNQSMRVRFSSPAPCGSGSVWLERLLAKQKVAGSNPAYRTMDTSFEIKDVFYITGRGVVVTGICLTGEINMGDVLYLDGKKRVTITGIERFVRELGKPVRPKDNVGLLLREIKSTDEIASGQLLVSGCDHECATIDEDYGSLGSGGSYEKHQCYICGDQHWVPLPD